MLTISCRRGYLILDSGIPVFSSDMSVVLRTILDIQSLFSLTMIWAHLDVRSGYGIHIELLV